MLSTDPKGAQPTLKKQSFKSGAKSQSSLNEEDRGKSLASQFMNMFAFGYQPKRDSKKRLETRQSQEELNRSKARSKHLKDSFYASKEDQNASYNAKNVQERAHKTLSTHSGIAEPQKSKCYSPKFNKPQLVKPPSQHNTSKGSTNRVTPLNLSSKSKFGLFHPRTTKNTDLVNREENVAGDETNVQVFGGAMVGLRGDLASVRSSQMLVLRSNQKGTSDKKGDIKNIASITAVKSARGHTEERRNILIMNELSKNKKMNTISGRSSSDSDEEGYKKQDKGRAKHLHYRGLNKPMSTMMIMRNNLTTGSKNGKKSVNNKPKHFVFPHHSSSMQKTMNTQILSMDKSHKKSHRQHQSFLSQEQPQEGSIIDS